ncbi:MAG: autotransporter outer membrane beta-barrel domain-containing protein, partial [Sutterellaceae bacterium]|nr:autotransporter outer membrane beta-barrel domain-containing protein [Sutterellaceae bacterium]
GQGLGEIFQTTITADNLTILQGEFDPDNTGAYTSTGLEARSGADLSLAIENQFKITHAVQDGQAVGIKSWRGDKTKGSPADSALLHSHIAISAQEVNISARSETFWAYGIQAYNSTTDADIAEDERSSVVIDAEKISINASSGVEEQSVGIIVWSQAKVKLTAKEISISAYRAINTRGHSVVEINPDGDTDSIVRINGDIVFEYNGIDSKTVINSTVNVKLTNAQSYWTGNTDKPTIGEPKEGDMDVAGFALTLADRATWTSTADSFVNNLTLENGVIAVSGENNNLTVDTMDGSGGTVNLGTKMVEGKAVANKVSIGKTAANTRSLLFNLDGVTTDDIRDANAIAEVIKESTTIQDAQASLDLTTTGYVDEGNLYGASSVTTDVKGEIKDQKTYSNTKLDAFKGVTSTTFVQWRNEVNHLTKRMGDLRGSSGEMGAWARVYGDKSEFDGSNVEFDTVSVQVGGDMRVNDWIVGAAFTYNDSSIDLDNGSGDGEGYGVALYASRLYDSGIFTDFTARYGFLKNDFTAKNMGVDTENHAFAVSAEVGYHYPFAASAYVEPQFELAYGFVRGDNVTASNGVTLNQDNFQTLTGRIGARIGLDCPQNRGTVYAQVGYNYEFLGDVESRASQGNDAVTIREELDGGWVSYGIGAQINISKALSAYGEFERTSGGDVKNPWRWNVGVRYNF